MPGGEHGSAAGTCSRSQPQRLDGVARPAFDGNRQHGRYTVVNPRERDWRAGAARGDGAGVSQGGRLTAAPQPPVSASCQAGHPRAAVPPPVTHRPAERLPLNPSNTLLPPLPGPRLDRLSRFLCRPLQSLGVFSLTLRHCRNGGGREGKERGVGTGFDECESAPMRWCGSRRGIARVANHWPRVRAGCGPWACRACGAEPMSAL